MVADMPCTPPPCAVAAAQKYQLSPLLVEAVRRHERGKIGEMKRNRDASIDHGPMQINSYWTRIFHASYGVPPEAIANDLCLNYEAGAFVLRYEINRAGGNVAAGVGRYHSPNPARAADYVVKIARQVQILAAGACR